MLLVIAGPAGAGKTTAIASLAERGFVTTRAVTSRSPRPSEAGSNEYVFVSKHEFQRQISDGELFDWDYYDGHYYGYEQRLLRLVMEQKVVIPVTARMAIRVRERIGVPSFLAFIDASDEVLDWRLQSRSATSGETSLRAALRVEERDHSGMFDAVLRGEDTDRLLEDLLRTVADAGF